MMNTIIKYNRSIWITLSFLILCIPFQAQVDSLLVVLENSTGTEKVDVLCELSFAEAQSNPPQAITYANEAALLADKLGYKSGKVSALHKLSVVLRFQGLYDQAVALSDSALKMTEGGAMHSLKASLYSNLGVCYRYKGMYDQALESFHEAIEIYRDLNDKPNIGSVLNNVGVMFMYLEDYPKAMEYYDRALKIQKETNNLKEVANSLNNFAIVYANQGALDSALAYFHQSLEIERRLGNQKGISESINNIGAVYYYMADYDNAIQWIRQSYEMDSVLGNVQGQVASINNIAEIYTEMGEHHKAVSLLEENLKKAREIDSKYDIEVSYLNLTNAYQQMGNFEKALENHLHFVSIHDTVLGEQQQNAIAEMETRFQTREKEQQIRIQELEIEEKEATLSARNNLIIGLIAALMLGIVAAIFGYSSYKAKKEAEFQRTLSKEQEKRLEAVIDATEQERKRIARELHDGIGQQLSSIKIGLSNFIQKTAISPENNSLEKIQKVVDASAREVRSLSHQMMPKALMELGLVPAMEDMLKNSLPLAGIEYEFEEVNTNRRFSEKIEITIYRVSQELINNIIRHSGATSVSVQLIKTGNFIQLIIQDNGRGMDHQNGGGHGLMNMNTRLKSVDGSIEFSKAEPSGTMVVARIPVGVKADQPQLVI